jgi:LysR family transcriptional regulator of gallate degradation
VHPSQFNLRHLRAFIAIADTGTITAAVRRVNLTQPAITHAIAKLERLIGVPLFERGPAGMTCTEAARRLIPRAQAALDLVASPAVTGPQMRAFVALARNGSYAASAKAVGVREASLHRAVADLSAGLGARLVERRGRGVALTLRGVTAARRFRLAEAELWAAIAELEALQGREVGGITIGAMPLSRALLLPNAIAAFARLRPQARVRVVEGSHAELVGPLRDGDIDLTIGALRGMLGEELVQEPLFVDRPMVIARSGHPLLAAAGRPEAAALARYSWIVPAEGAPLREEWRQIFARGGIAAPAVTIECGSVIVVRQLLLLGDFLTLLSPVQVAVELEAGWLATVGPPPGEPSRTIGLTTRTGWRPTPLQRVFLDCLKKEAEAVSRSGT